MTVTQKKRPTNKRRSQKGSPLSAYELSRINPFHLAVNGVRAPDEFGFPTGTMALRNQIGPLTSTTNVNYLSCAFLPFMGNYFYKAADVSVGNPATTTWSGGAFVATTQATAISNLASVGRSVGWGVKITCEQSFNNAAGHLWVAHCPLNFSTGVPYNGFPTTESMIAQNPMSAKFALPELLGDGLIIPGRPFDDGIYRFRDVTGAEEKAVSANAVESADGWCAIVIMLVTNGLSSQTVVLNFEHVNHVEYIQNASGGYGFLDSAPMPHNEALIEKASRISVASPMGFMENMVSGVEQAASVGTRLYNAASGLARVVGLGSQAAALLSASRNRGGSGRIPRITYPGYGM